MTRIDQHLNHMFRSIPASHQARTLKDTLRQDALEKLEEYRQEGLSPDQAELRVVEELGDGRELAETLPRTTSAQRLALAAACLLALLLLGSASVYHLFFQSQALLTFDLRFQWVSSFLLLPLGLAALGYALGYPMRKYALKALSYRAAKGLLLAGAAVLAAYLLLLLLHFSGLSPAGLLLVSLAGWISPLSFGAGLSVSLGIN